MSESLATSSVRLDGSGQSAPIDSTGEDAAAARPTARQLSLTLDRAMALGIWEHAERVARSAARVAQFHAGLTERIARLKMIQGDAEAALTVIESCNAQPASLRLLRNICLIQTGRRGEAHIDLHRWSSRAACPLQARSMLALLEREVGDIDAAANALLRNLRHMDDPRTLAMLMLLSTEQERVEQSEMWAQRLRNSSAATDVAPMMDIVLRSLGKPGINAIDEPQESHVHALCTELLTQEETIGALVAALELHPERASCRLLAAAIESALPELESAAVGYEALARLNVAMNDIDAALDWARRGLEVCPMSAALARLTCQLCDRGARTDESCELEQAA